MSITRRDFPWLGTTAAAATGGYVVGQKMQPGPPSSGRRAPYDSGFELKIRVRGGYALVFANDELSMGSVAAEGMPCHWVDHPMQISVPVGLVQPETTLPRKSGCYAIPDGGTAFFSEGVKDRKIKKKKHTRRDKLRDVYPTGRPTKPEEWDDFVWLADLGKAVGNWQTRLRRRIDLPGGTVSAKIDVGVRPPTNPYAEQGRWKFGTPDTQALSDRFALDAGGTGDRLVLKVMPQNLILAVTPEAGTIVLEIRPFIVEKD